MISILLFAAQAAAPAPPAGSVVPPVVLRPHAVPIMRTEWLSEEDFPAEQADAADLRFAARLDVTADGTVDGCAVTKTSGQGAFDQRACTVLRKRARFRPALDPNGVPIGSGYTFRLPWAAATRPAAVNPGAWVTADDYPSAALRAERVGRTAVLALVEANGRVSDCVVTSSSGHPDLDERTCTIVTRRGRYRPATDGEGTAVPSSHPYVVNWRLPDE